MRTLIAASTLAIVLTVACTDSNRAPESSSTAPPAATSGSEPAGGAPKVQTACEVLTPVEIAGFLKVPDVRKDDLNSVKNQFTGVDLCNWYVKEGSPEGLGITLRRAASDDEGGRAIAFSSAKNDAVEHDVKRGQGLQPVAVGDEAVYGPYPVPPGGSIVVRVGSVVVTMTGSASKEAFIAMARLTAQRI